MTELVFTLKPPFDFALSVGATRHYSAFGVIHNGAYRRLLRAGNGVALIELYQQADDAPETVRAHVLATRGEVDEEILAGHMSHIVNVDAEREPFYASASRHAGLSETVERVRGLHLFRFENLFDALGCTIIEQQISLKAAQLAERWICTWGGESLIYHDQPYYTFPSIERLASASTDDLIPTKITFIRMRALISIAQAALNEQIDFEGLRNKSWSEAYNALIALKGVGHWTASWAIIRTFGHFLYFGRADVALRAAVNAYYLGQSGRADPDAMDVLFTSFGDYAGSAAYHTIMRYAIERY